MDASRVSPQNALHPVSREVLIEILHRQEGGTARAMPVVAGGGEGACFDALLPRRDSVSHAGSLRRWWWW